MIIKKTKQKTKQKKKQKQKQKQNKTKQNKNKNKKNHITLQGFRKTYHLLSVVKQDICFNSNMI